MTQIASIYRLKENYRQAIEYLVRVLEADKVNGELWSELGHCYLMTDDLKQAFAAYQNALQNLDDPKV